MNHTPVVRVDVEDSTGVVIATIKDYRALSFDIAWSGRGTYQLTLTGFTDWSDIFRDDHQIRIWYKDARFGLDWVNVFTGFHKTSVENLAENGNLTFQSFGPSLEEIVTKEYVLWYARSAQASKSGAVAAVMAEYVTENCGVAALASNGRDADGVVPGLTISNDGSGPTWSGSRARKPLRQVLDDLRSFSIANGDHVDWRVISTGGYTWQFQAGKLGVDRTAVGLDPSTGLNAAGNVPVVFSPDRKNIISATRSRSGANALTEVVALGNGKGANRAVVVVTDAAGLAASAIARRVGLVTSSTTDTGELQDAADARLRQRQPTDKFTFQPRDVGDDNPAHGGTVLFRDYNIGDYITAYSNGQAFHKQIIGAHFELSAGDTIINRTLVFADV